MAYLQFEPMPDTSAGSATRPRGIPLSALEREVVRLSYGDTRASLGPTDRLARFARGLGNRRHKAGLADRRLEALRRYAVLYRLDGQHLDPTEDAAIATAGFDPRAIGEVMSLVDRYVARHAGNAGFGVGSLVNLSVGTMIFAAVAVLIQQATDDVIASAIISGILGATALSLRHPTAHA